ncbi:P-loop containing nucleoside triphosphate hydrolase protein [Dichotomopilus funicola]|uniref:P-loop containing nucleoside triphosphate hydrolase protein n=1 Tax=Dichotomopilus funicola TaxID=1934379 RepID=A0AAN6VAZ9_9PEZI|nr:P-loop containing nucleoside triphosphate hydrolase protein [Dichotomopilus funicola]
MDATLSRLLDIAWDRFTKAPENTRFLIAIGGIPGSGKTTLSQRLTTALNARHAALTSQPQQPQQPIAAFVPMDGYHLTRAQLDALPDPATAHARRGAEFTFDGASFVQLVRQLKQEGEPLTEATPTVYAPSFDHAVKDPKEGDIAIGGRQRIVVLEGNYLLLDTPPWSQAIPLFSLTIFVSVPRATARARLASRHVAAGLVTTLADGDRRAIENDLPNGDEILQRRVGKVDVEVESLEDGGWV